MEANDRGNAPMSEIQRYAMEPTYAQSNCSMVASVALVKHPQGQVVLYADHEKVVADLQAKLEEAMRENERLTVVIGELYRLQEPLHGDLQRLRTENTTLQEMGITMSSQIGRFQIELAEKDRIIATLTEEIQAWKRGASAMSGFDGRKDFQK